MKDSNILVKKVVFHSVVLCPVSKHTFYITLFLIFLHYSGWGYTDMEIKVGPDGEKKTRAVSPDVLMQTTLPIVSSPNKGCHNNKKVMCAGYGFETRYPVACSGDSGGPFICRQPDGSWQVEGVTSFVHSLCKYYTAFAPVNEYIDWINKYVQN